MHLFGAAAVDAHRIEKPVAERCQLPQPKEAHPLTQTHTYGRTHIIIRTLPPPLAGDTGTRRYMAPEVVLCKPQYDEKVYTVTDTP
jgi:hypothetical protein